MRIGTSSGLLNMTTSGTSADTTDHALKVDCHQCHTRYRVRHSNRLTSVSSQHLSDMRGTIRGGERQAHTLKT